MRFFRILAGLTVIGALLISGGCAHKTVVPGSIPGEELFVTAEKQYNQGLYNSALNLYQDYLVTSPKGENVPGALLRVGDVSFVRGEYAEARRQYSQLITRFPESLYAEDARIGVLLSWFNEQEYRRVLDYADTIDDEQVSDHCVARKYATVSDTYLAMGESGDAAYVLISGLRKVGAEAQKEILIKLNQISDKIGVQALQKLLAAVKDPGFRGYLSCQMGDRYIQQQEYEQAAMILSDFISAYPDNAYAEAATEMMRQMKKASVYDAYSIGCLLPLSGEYRLFGERALKGVQLAFQEFVMAHSREGKGPPPVKLIIGDSGSTADQAVAAVKKLADKKVAAIIGPLGPFTEAIREAEKRYIPIIALSQEADIPTIGKYVFRNFLTPQMQIDSLVSYACRTLGLRKFAVLYPDEEYGSVFANKFWDEVLKYGGEMVAFESYNPTETDFAEPIKKLVGLYYKLPEGLKAVREQRLVELGLKADGSYLDDIIPPDPPDEETDIVDEEDHAVEDDLEEEEQKKEEDDEEKALVDFDALFIPDGPSNAGMIIPQLAFYDIVRIQLLGTNLWYSQELIDTAGWYAQGAVLPAAFWETGNPGTDESFSFRYERVYSETPDFISAVAYDSAAILMNIIIDTDLRYRHSIIKRLAALKDYPGVTGRTAFDMSGEVRKALTLLRIKGRRFVRINEAVENSLNEGGPSSDE